MISSFVMALGQRQHAKWNIRSSLGAGARLNGATCWPQVILDRLELGGGQSRVKCDHVATQPQAPPAVVVCEV
jgi:hypothetical protein